MSDQYEWFCTLCEATFLHNQETEALEHMWDQHGSGDPFRMFKWQDGEILELEERKVAP